MSNKENKKEMKNVKIIELTKDDAKWYGSTKAKYLVRFNNIGAWTKYASIKNGKYSDNPETGFLIGNGNLGTNSALFEKINF